MYISLVISERSETTLAPSRLHRCLPLQKGLKQEKFSGNYLDTTCFVRHCGVVVRLLSICRYLRSVFKGFVNVFTLHILTSLFCTVSTPTSCIQCHMRILSAIDLLYRSPKAISVLCELEK